MLISAKLSWRPVFVLVSGIVNPLPLSQRCDYEIITMFEMFSNFAAFGIFSISIHVRGYSRLSSSLFEFSYDVICRTSVQHLRAQQSSGTYSFVFVDPTETLSTTCSVLRAEKLDFPRHRAQNDLLFCKCNEFSTFLAHVWGTTAGFGRRIASDFFAKARNQLSSYYIVTTIIVQCTTSLLSDWFLHHASEQLRAQHARAVHKSVTSFVSCASHFSLTSTGFLILIPVLGEVYDRLEEIEHETAETRAAANCDGTIL